MWLLSLLRDTIRRLSSSSLGGGQRPAVCHPYGTGRVPTSSHSGHLRAPI
ncbi:hypothetical protein CTAM01_12813 [Colletotrichum tamarilloi]|uniref:Actin n=1 Tax=Colletotrichum tamarilloi TaxID=1209934 RepID=A0ABQ9QTQ2_9PEZI|nr:uncharacterized protein CTAM01_12813 [Colletotrichum tamarilloi]KAK1484724.1 hypothetical protein CTAM01_12813 [Colletotrichum tamarilloi]